jgi:hypothetical protein
MRRSYSSNLAFLDLLFNTLLCFVAFFAIALVLINPESENRKVEVKAEFIISMSWPGDINDDVDLYVEDPAGNLVSYSRREDGLMHLDRDDLGQSNDIVETEFGSIEYNENREIVTIRGTVPGEYVINVHMYSKRSEESTPVFIQVDKINPFSTVFTNTVNLQYDGHEETAVRIVVDKDSNVESVNYLRKSLTRSGEY